MVWGSFTYEGKVSEKKKKRFYKRDGPWLAVHLEGKKRSQPWSAVHLHRKERFQENKGEKRGVSLG